MSHQECLDAHHRGRIDDLAQLRMYWNLEMRFLTTFGLALIDNQGLIVNMLPPKLDDVAAALACVKQECEGEPLSLLDELSRIAKYDLPTMSCNRCF